jgi:hypothetical protein
MGKQRSVARQGDRVDKKHKGPPPSLRIAHIRKWLQVRYGHVLPNNDAGRDAAFVMCCHLANGADAPKRIRNWLSLATPWMMLPEREKLLANAVVHPYRWSADKIAHKLGGVTDADRHRYGLWTLGAVDVSKEERETQRRERDRLRKMTRRRKDGATPRAEYEANSLSKTKPWIALGMSRATYYRRRVEPGETSASPVYLEACMVRTHLSHDKKGGGRGRVFSIAEGLPVGRPFQVGCTRSC